MVPGDFLFCQGTDDYLLTNAVQSARELYIHRSTFLYRLERIRALLDSDLTDYDELLYLMISFYLLKEDQPKRQDDSQ